MGSINPKTQVITLNDCGRCAAGLSLRVQKYFGPQVIDRLQDALNALQDLVKLQAKFTTPANAAIQLRQFLEVVRAPKYIIGFLELYEQTNNHEALIRNEALNAASALTDLIHVLPGKIQSFNFEFPESEFETCMIRRALPQRPDLRVRFRYPDGTVGRRRIHDQ